MVAAVMGGFGEVCLLEESLGPRSLGQVSLRSKHEALSARALSLRRLSLFSSDLPGLPKDGAQEAKVCALARVDAGP